jgi:hypothetical protein
MVCQRCAGDRKFNINFVVADVYTFLPANMENSEGLLNCCITCRTAACDISCGSRKELGSVL